MARRTRYSTFHLLQPLLQAIVSGGGLLGGLAVGVLVAFCTGLLKKSGEVLNAPLGSMTKIDLLIVGGSIAIIFGFGWLGARIGLALITKMRP